MKPSAPTMNMKLLDSMDIRCTLPSLSGSMARPSTASFWCITTSQATSPTTSVLAMALTSSTSAFEETMLTRPLNGLSLAKFGAMALPENSQPPTSSGDASATTITATPIGRQASSTRPTSTPTRWISTSVLKTCSRSSASPDTIAELRSRTMPLPVNHRQAPAAINTVNVATSRDRGTSPSSRACSRRFADAGSVFSASLSSAIKHSVDFRCPPRRAGLARATRHRPIIDAAARRSSPEQAGFCPPVRFCFQEIGIAAPACTLARLARFGPLDGLLDGAEHRLAVAVQHVDAYRVAEGHEGRERRAAGYHFQATLLGDAGITALGVLVRHRARADNGAS